MIRAYVRARMTGQYAPKASLNLEALLPSFLSLCLLIADNM